MYYRYNIVCPGEKQNQNTNNSRGASGESSVFLGYHVPGPLTKSLV